MKIPILLLSLVLVLSCKTNKESSKIEGLWRGVINTDLGELPFTFSIEKKGENYLTSIHNGEENLAFDSTILKNDSLFIINSIFDASLSVKIEGDSMRGFYEKSLNSGERVKAPFKAKFNENYRFSKVEKMENKISPIYETTFWDEKDKYPAIGEFKQVDNKVTGTFLTETGDYRYLEGNIIGEELFLSTFDGNHAFLFKARINGDQLIDGKFNYISGEENWQAKANPNAKLKDAYSLTYLKEGYDKFEFSFRNTDAKLITLEDKEFENKVVLVQISGSWCPNCMDETKFLVPLYEKNKDRLSVVALMFERSDDPDIAIPKLIRMKEKFNINYNVCLAGKTDEESREKALPMLNKIMSFPTLVVLDKKHNVRSIHTGFSGPATGKNYENFVKKFNEELNSLLTEY